MNLIKKLIITSLVIFSCDNIIASEIVNISSNPISNTEITSNQQMQNTLPVQNYNQMGINTNLDVNKINELLKPANIDINEFIMLVMKNPSMLQEKLTDAGYDMNELKQLMNNPTLWFKYVTFNEDINPFDMLKTSILNNSIKPLMISNEISMLVKAFIDNNNDVNKTANLLKTRLGRTDVTNELFVRYTKQNIDNIIKNCNKADIIIPKENDKSLYSVIDALFNELNKSNDINDYMEKYFNLLGFVTVDKAMAINAVSLNIQKIKAMEQKDKDKFKGYLLYRFKSSLEETGNKLKGLEEEIKMMQQISETIKNDSNIKANMSDSQRAIVNKLIECFIKIDNQEIQYLTEIQEIAQSVGINTGTFTNNPTQNNTTTTSEQK